MGLSTKLGEVRPLLSCRRTPIRRTGKPGAYGGELVGRVGDKVSEEPVRVHTGKRRKTNRE